MLQSVFNFLVKNVSDSLYRYIISQGISAEEARDIMQNCFMALWKSKVEDELEGKKYLFGVAYKQCADFWRSHYKNKKTKGELDQLVYFDSNMSKNIVNRALTILSEQQRALVLLKDVQGYSYSEIAEITELNESQVKVYLHRARMSLKNFIVKLENVV